MLEEKNKNWVKSIKNKNSQIDPNSKKYFNISDNQINMRISIDDLTNSLKDDTLFCKFSNLF